MIPAVTIIGIKRVENPETWDDGARAVAFYDCEVRGFQFRDCLLIKTARGGITTQLPRGSKRDSGARANRILDDAVRNSMIYSASRAFEALGGKL